MRMLKNLLVIMILAAPALRGSVIDVREAGAVPDGKTLCTAVLQKAIDRCAEAGGGTVYFPSGRYLSGTIILKSHVTLDLEENATLLGSARLADYPPLPAKVQSRTNRYAIRSLIYAEDLDGIGIVGRGTLDGNGAAYYDKSHDGNRPLLLRVINCRDVLVENIRMQNSGFWNQHYLACRRVRLQGVRVFNHATYNVDGVDIDGCRDFTLSDCILDSDDDALCLKSTIDQPCENILVTNCLISSHCNAVKMGTDSSSGFRNVTITNCAIVAPRDSKVIYGLQRGISGISLEIVDGGLMDRVVVSNVTIDGVEVPIFIRLGNRGYGFLETAEKPKGDYPVGALRNISFTNVIATRAGKTGCSIVGLPGHLVENVLLSGVTIRSEGGGEAAWAANAVQEFPEKYPEATMFGKLPAFGLYCRHVKGLTLSNVRLETDDPDGRHALVLDDVRDTGVDGLAFANASDAAALVKIVDGDSIMIRGCRPDLPKGLFLRVEGAGTKGVFLTGNDFTRAGKAFELTSGADPSSLKTAGNSEK
jgi:polygalacturonase